MPAPAPLPRLDGRRALVTGGNRGIGLEIADGLIALGAQVTILARDARQGGLAAQALGAELFVGDLEDPASLAPLVEGAGFDILVNNAGVLPEGKLSQNPEGYFQCMAVMANAPFLLIRAFGPGMVARGWGRIVNVSSDWGSFAEGLHGPNGYGIAKAALNAMTVAWARELGAPVRVNAMCPGWVRTRMGGGDAPRDAEAAADTALWLASLPDDGPTGGFFRDRAPLGW
jgi:NAD(P)-dependent dehydrogenase (short-subunit alcohol dehydrogenase family)